MHNRVHHFLCDKNFMTYYTVNALLLCLEEVS